jgi:hypothetical protein
VSLRLPADALRVLRPSPEPEAEAVEEEEAASEPEAAA